MKQELREAVFARDSHCVKCGKLLHEPVAVHHRKLRKQGGKDELCNLIALCSPCHNIAPDSVHQNPKRSYEMGWLVPSWADPAKWPITLTDGSQIYLDNEGSMIKEEGQGNGW